MLCKFCSSKYTSTLISRSIRVILMQSRVFRANRLMDLTIIIPTFLGKWCGCHACVASVLRISHREPKVAA